MFLSWPSIKLLWVKLTLLGSVSEPIGAGLEQPLDAVFMKFLHAGLAGGASSDSGSANCSVLRSAYVSLEDITRI